MRPHAVHVRIGRLVLDPSQRADAAQFDEAIGRALQDQLLGAASERQPVSVVSDGGAASQQIPNAIASQIARRLDSAATTARPCGGP